MGIYEHKIDLYIEDICLHVILHILSTLERWEILMTNSFVHDPHYYYQ